MEKLTKLPDTEFEIMKVIWASEPPVSTHVIMEQIGHKRKWKTPTAISLLLRLVERGFLQTEKRGKERVFFPAVDREDYLRFETGNFMRLYHEDSFVSFISTLYGGKDLNEADLEELKKWMEEGRK